MLFSARQLVHPGVRARDLPALMELYELNYIQLRRLIPDLQCVADENVSRIDGAVDLHLSVLERTRYTTTLYLTYQFPEEAGLCAAPDVVVRVYHDAQLAEVLSRGRRKGRREAEYDRLHHQYPLETKWKANRFLHKWLGYCLHHGHHFPPVSRPDADPAPVADGETALGLES